MNPQLNQHDGPTDQVPVNMSAPAVAPPLPFSPAEQQSQTISTAHETVPTPNTSSVDTVLPQQVPLSPTQSTDSGSMSGQSQTMGQGTDLSNLVAADTDVIEREWVAQIERAINDTRDDPYAQVQAIEKIRAEYMKKRYNKELKQEQS